MEDSYVVHLCPVSLGQQCIGLVVELRSQPLMPANRIMYNTFMSFILIAWR
jgi:hypothetical protein